MRKKIVNGPVMQKAVQWIAALYSVICTGLSTMRRIMEQLSSGRRNLVKGISNDEIQVIGVEFTVTMYNGERQELAMFSPQGLIIPRLRSGGKGWNGYKPSITFHTTDGDFTMQDYNGQCPW